MDDIQFWLYLAFAAIYFFVRMMRKKAPEESSEASEDTQANQPRKRPVSFEELLREIQEQRQPAREVVAESPKPVAVQEPKKKKKEEAPQDGVRRFYDDESRKVYEESIRMAEGHNIDFKRDEHFESRMKRREEETADTGKEILESLQNTENARKAVILGEILNRRY